MQWANGEITDLLGLNSSLQILLLWAGGDRQFQFWLGAIDPELFDASRRRGVVLPSLHTPYFAPEPEPTITTGVVMMSAAALDLFGAD